MLSEEFFKQRFRSDFDTATWSYHGNEIYINVKFSVYVNNFYHAIFFTHFLKLLQQKKLVVTLHAQASIVGVSFHVHMYVCV